MLSKLFVNIKTFFIMFKQLMEILEKKQRLQCILLLAGVFVCAMLETLGVSAVIPFVLVMFNPESLLENKYGAIVADMFQVSTYKQLLFLTAFLVVLVYFTKNSVLLIFQYFQGKFHNEIEKCLMTKQYKMFMLRPYSYYLNVNSSEVLRGLSSDITQVTVTMDAFISLASESITVIMIGLFIVIMDPLMAFGLIGTAILIAFVFVFLFKRKTSEIGKKCREIFSKRYKIALESVGGYKEISINQKKDYFINEYNEVNEEACKLNTSYLLIMKIPSRAIETIFITCLLFLACCRIQMYEDNAQFITLISAMGVAAIRILPSISNISASINGLVYNRIGLNSAYENIMQVKEEAQKQHDIMLSRKKQINSIVFQDNISLNNVSFRYEKSDVDILKDVNLKIYKNESVGFIGESGAGKSTLLDVLLGLHRPQEGKVLMDNYDIEDIPFDWAENVGYVPQTVFLLDNTIRRNIAFGIPDEDIDDNKIWECLEKAQLDIFVRELPNGLDTTVGDRGVRFSGGQRQRVAIARALYHDPQILVLDEATSALDNETEQEVMRAIDGFKGELTIIIVAHRLSTIENCNKVYVVGNGNVILKKN